MLLSEMCADEVWPWNLEGYDFPADLVLRAAQTFTPISFFNDGYRCYCFCRQLLSALFCRMRSRPSASASMPTSAACYTLTPLASSGTRDTGRCLTRCRGCPSRTASFSRSSWCGRSRSRVSRSAYADGVPHNDRTTLHRTWHSCAWGATKVIYPAGCRWPQR